jgi:hypothetical protein
MKESWKAKVNRIEQMAAEILAETESDKEVEEAVGAIGGAIGKAWNRAEMLTNHEKGAEALAWGFLVTNE